MFRPSQELTALSAQNSITKRKGFAEVQQNINVEMINQANKGKQNYTVNVNTLVDMFMAKDTEYSEVADEIATQLAKESYIVGVFSNYKEESLEVRW